MSTATIEQEEWLFAKPAAEILGVDLQTVMKLGKRGYITLRVLPGCYPRYLRSDVERLARESVKPATAGIPAARINRIRTAAES